MKSILILNDANVNKKKLWIKNELEYETEENFIWQREMFEMIFNKKKTLT